MNSLQIEGLLKKDSQAKKIFKNVCALDEIEVPSYPSAYVINSDTSDKKGEHWVAVYFDKNRRGEYFDSYELPPAILGLEACLHGSIFDELDLQPQDYTKIIFKCVRTLLCIFYFISLS